MIDEKQLAELYRLKNLIRYNTRTRLKDETVAEHSFYVALLSLIICDELCVDDNVKLDCITKSLLHDLPEIEINDITHDAKLRMGLNEKLKKFEDEYYSRNFSKYFELMNSSDETLSSLIVNLADAESVKQYIQNEINLGNNSLDIKEVKAEITDRIVHLENKLNDFHL